VLRGFLARSPALLPSTADTMSAPGWRGLKWEYAGHNALPLIEIDEGSCWERGMKSCFRRSVALISICGPILTSATTAEPANKLTANPSSRQSLLECPFTREAGIRYILVDPVSKQFKVFDSDRRSSVDLTANARVLWGRYFVASLYEEPCGAWPLHFTRATTLWYGRNFATFSEMISVAQCEPGGEKAPSITAVRFACEWPKK
jgi:hypothetical protein